MKILCGKFSELRRHSLHFFYTIRDHPSTMLYNDEDLEVMFAVADSIGLNCIEVTVTDNCGFDSGTSGCGGDVGANSSGVFDSGGDVGGSTSKGISFSGQGLVGRQLESMGDVGKEDDLGAMFYPHQQRPSGKDLSLYVECYFHVESYRQVYSKPIFPVVSLWKGDVANCGTSILPPLSKKLPGRPKKEMIRSNGENVREMKCGRCGKMGNHNKLTCKEDLRPDF
ncbi:hypothetical protein RHMOL_Rhmol13G0176500 [Rhododendron molle]|uniref:Uncharacterized protein n=1 Tax=Rhododendron molle TaxID=49168 RepID=A0ACC0L8T0_RHOML|nr:hypothetical protein RHMOL_Rhmol13G0176500 [Rhododendron molle]